MSERAERTLIISAWLTGSCVIITLINDYFVMNVEYGVSLGFFGCMLIVNYNLQNYIVPGLTKTTPIEKKKTVPMGFR